MLQLSTLILLCVWTTRSGAVNYVFDEFLFSKDTWDSWKIDDPLEDFNPSDLLPKAKELYPGYELADFNSLDGPRARVPPSQKASSSQGGVPDMDALDDESMVEPAAKAAQCTMCHVLVSVVWSRLTNRVVSGDSVTVPHIKEQLRDACEKDALDVMLRKNTILRMERSGGGATSVLLFVVRERRDGSRGASATEAEEEAASLSCKGLVAEHGDDLADVLMTQLANYRREALRLLVKHGRGGDNTQDAQAPEPAAAGSLESRSGSGSGSRGHLPRLDSGNGVPRDEDDDYVDPDDLDDEGDVKKAAGGRAAGGLTKAAAVGVRRTVRGLSIQVKPGEPECEDLNPMCASWAASGECQSNPNYMIGTDKHRGHCRKACGVCQPDDVLAGSPELASELDAVSSALLLAAKNLGCGAGGPCLSGVSGMAMGAGLLKQQQSDTQEPKELPPGMKQLPGGFILGKPWWAQPEVRIVPQAQRKPVPAAESAGAAASGAGDGPAAGGPGADLAGRSSGGGIGSGSSDPPSQADVDRVLTLALAHKLLSIPSDFFIYEYLYKNHTRHFHADRNGDITEDWLLGRFTREAVSLMSSATEEVAGLEELDLLPGSPHGAALKAHTWPYVRQVYAGGDECVLGGGRRVVRRVEARIACSPDDHTYMLIREPDFCTYIFVIYVPELCTLDYYKPRPKGGAAAGGGSGQAAGAGAGGSTESKKRRRTSSRGT